MSEINISDQLAHIGADGELLDSAISTAAEVKESNPELDTAMDEVYKILAKEMGEVAALDLFKDFFVKYGLKKRLLNEGKIQKESLPETDNEVN